MTVAELIEKLQRCPQDAKVLTSDNEWGHQDDFSATLMDAFFGPAYPGAPRDSLLTEKHQLRDRVPNCKVVVISHFYEDGEEL